MVNRVGLGSLRQDVDAYGFEEDSLWFKDAIIYEVPVRAYADHDNDGVGDLQGLISKLDYLQDLGITAIWLLPFFPSPLRDDGYDISDYTSINVTLGSLEDFKVLIREAHQRRIRVIIELVVNHTSDQHPWFQRARRSEAGSSWRNFYVWSDTPEKYQEARIIFQDFESSNWTWDPLAKAYYWHRFYSHQPDLNFENPEVHRAIFEALDFWLTLGVDGLRLDAVPYLYEAEGTNCENLPATHAFLKNLRSHVDQHYPNRMLLAEANQWPEDAVAYMGDGDECHMDFHFPLMPRLFMAIQMEDRFPIIDILQQTPPIPDNCQWAIFLRNHDELTLEMVTDEDRDYMYRMYARDPQARVNLGIRRRLAPLLGNNRRSIELMNGLLFSLPGTPVLYYGDEIGMGDNIYLGDRNGVRTPMQWSADRNAGFSRANPQRLCLPIVIEPEYHYESINVEAQRENRNSLWWWMKRLIAVRKRFQAFGRGSFEVLYPDNRKVLVFLRIYENERILMVANLSRYVQSVEVDLSRFEGMIPVEIFGRTEFPPIGELPYFFTLGPYSFYWFSLEMQHAPILCAPGPFVDNSRLPLLILPERWENLFYSEFKNRLELILPTYLCSQPWFHNRAQVIQATTIRDTIPVMIDAVEIQVALVVVDYAVGPSETYLLPLVYVLEDPAQREGKEFPSTAIAEVQVERRPETGLLIDAFADRPFLKLPLQAITQQTTHQGLNGQLIGHWIQPAHPDPSQLPHDSKPEDTNGSPEVGIEPRILRREDSNPTVLYGDRYALKLFRFVEEGIHPAWEMGRYLAEQQTFSYVPPVVGELAYQQGKTTQITLGILQEYQPHEGDAWSYTLDNLTNFFERIIVHHADQDQVPLPNGKNLEWLDQEVPDLAYDTIGGYLESARLLGQRTAELHVALGAPTDNHAFAPEAFSTLYQRSIYQSMRNLVGHVLPMLKKRILGLSGSVLTLAEAVQAQEAEIITSFRRILEKKISAMRTRVHGNYQLAQLLFTGKDFVIMNLEGDPTRPLTERRLKRSPLRDVAGLLQSFDHAVQTALRAEIEGGMIQEANLETMQTMKQWTQFWYVWVSAAFLNAYLQGTHDQNFFPRDPADLNLLLEVYLLEEAFAELHYELKSGSGRADDISIPLNRILNVLQV